MAKSKSLKNKNKKPTEEPITEFDINAFIQDQQLQVDEDVIPLLSESVQPLKKKKNSNKIKSYKESTTLIKSSPKTVDPSSSSVKEKEQDQDESMDSEDEKEMEAYIQMMMSEKNQVQEGEGKDMEGEMTVKTYPNLKNALSTRLKEIQLPSEIPWIETLSVTSKEPCMMDQDQVHDDLERELYFYQQALHGAVQGRNLIIKAGYKFSRPDDYFAEMIKSDEHMARIRQRLLDEAQSLKASELARKQREAKKFGKKVQMEKLAERQESKKKELEQIKLARKKKDSVKNNNPQDDNDDDLFNVSVDKNENKKGSSGSLNNNGKKKSNPKRVKKDSKFGFGGPKKNRKSNTRESTDDLKGFNLKKMKGKMNGVGKRRK